MASAFRCRRRCFLDWRLVEPSTRPTSTRSLPRRYSTVVARTTGPSARKAFGATWNGAPSGCGKAMVTSRSFLTWQEALEPLAVGFSASGIEIYSRLKFGKFAVVGGFEDYIPRDLNPLINPNFKTRYAILGAEWHFSKSGYAFSKRGSATPWMRREWMYPTRRRSASVTTSAGEPRIPSNAACPARVRKAAIAEEGDHVRTGISGMALWQHPRGGEGIKSA